MENKFAKANVTDKVRNKDAWRAALDSVSINDDHWWCMVTIIVETIAEHSRYVSLFNEAAEERKRTCIYSLGYQKVIMIVRTLSKQDPEKCPVIQGICHHANTIINENENSGNLSAWLMARIIKYLIYRAKIKHVERLKLQANLDSEIEDERRIVQNNEASTSSQSTFGYRRANNSERMFPDKAYMRSRKRHEEQRDANDEPLDGPNFYVVLSGFHDPDLPAELLSVGVPLVCILEIKPVGEQYVANREPKEINEPKEKDPLKNKSRFFENYRVSEKQLMEFWTRTRDRISKPSMYPIYSDIVILAFCPSILPRVFNATEKESLKRDIYSKIFLALCDLYNLCRQYANYLKSMKLEGRIIDARDKRGVNTKIYEDMLNDIPNEYINVPLILGAMLLQVEANLTISHDQHSGNHDTRFNDVDIKYGNKSTTAEQISVSTVHDKLKLLDLKYELSDAYIDSVGPSSQSSDLKLILYGDILSEIAYRFLNRGSINLVDSVLRVLREPRIMNIWQDREMPTESKTKIYSHHLDNIARAYDPEQAVSREEITHYIHLLMFDKLIFSGNGYEAKARMAKPSEDEPLRYARLTTRRTHSESNLKLASIITSDLRRCRSDTEIDYGKPADALIECPLLFALIDIREALLSGYLYKNVFEKRSHGRPTIDEYEDVELLSDRVFLQVVHECLQSFDRFAARYFEPTDSVLFYFSNSNEVGSVFEETRLSSIRTPVGLREFHKYIVQEEENWMKQEQKTRQSCGMDSTERFMKKSVEVEDSAIIFDDGCFVLLDSLKGRRLRKSLDRDTPKKISGTRKSREEAIEEEPNGKKTTRQKRNEVSMMKNASKRVNGRVTNGETSTTEKRSNLKVDNIDTSFLPKRNALSYRCAEEGEPHDFVGYDLGRLRVQVCHRSKKIRLYDDISVQVELEDWLYGSCDIHIAVTLRDCALRLSRGINRSADTFHLTTKSGIVLSFCRNKELGQNLSTGDYHWRNLAFDFRASWPSGLLIEPTVGDGTKNPFCIRQSYVSKRPACAGATREVCRNFLRDGTVLRYLDDNTVVILRPNGVIVTCMDFDKSQSHDEFARQIIIKKSKIGESNSKQAMSKRKEEIIYPVYLDGSIVDVQNNGDDTLMTTTAFITGKASRYTVVNYDGRRYEVLNDKVVREYDRLLVKTVSDDEVGETSMRRTDGTDVLFRSNGELVVTFADGTRITTGYTIEEQPVICEWSEDELRRYFDLAEMDGYEGDGISSSKSGLPHGNSYVLYLNHREKLARISIADGFVSILLTCRVEHRHYATVSYDQSAVRCTLSMPDDLRVSISRRGHYEVSIGDEVNLKTCNDNVEFSKLCITCGGSSKSIYKFCEPSEADLRTILTTVDILGNVLEIKEDGTTRYHNENCGERGRCEYDSDVLVHSEKMSNEEEKANLEAKFHCKHERYCEKLKFPARSQYRIFAMNRDLTACEYLHRSVRREQEMAAVLDDETSMIQYPISHRPKLRRLITFVPVEPELGSKEMSYQQKVLANERTDRIELSRSTYSFPYNWLFPFGKKDHAVLKRTRNEHPLPELLRARILFGIKETDRSILSDMQRTMGLYLTSVFRDSDKYRSFCAAISSRFRETENNYASAEDKQLRDLALGVKRSIDIQTYVRSLRDKLIKVDEEVPRQSNRLTKLLRQRASMKEEYEWYKQCMRKQITAPYFRNVADSCYFLIKDLVDEVLRISEKGDSHFAKGKK